MGLILEAQAKNLVGERFIVDVIAFGQTGDTTHCREAVERHKIIAISLVVTVVLAIEGELNTCTQVITNVVVCIAVFGKANKRDAGLDKQSEVLIGVVFCLKRCGGSYIEVLEV